jgi:Fe-S-cluster containining protein
MSDGEDNLKQIHVKIDSRVTHLGPGKIDCVKGCSYCCHFPVSIHSLAEARLALQEAERTYTRKALSNLKEDIYRQFRLTRKVKTVPEFNQLKLACPFLVNDVCSIYAARPISCRTCVSNDKIVCMSALGPSACTLSADTELQQYLRAINQYRETLYQDMSFGDCMLELRAALVYVLEGGAASANNFPIDPMHAASPEGQDALRKSAGSALP